MGTVHRGSLRETWLSCCVCLLLLVWQLGLLQPSECQPVTRIGLSQESCRISSHQLMLQLSTLWQEPPPDLAAHLAAKLFFPKEHQTNSQQVVLLLVLLSIKEPDTFKLQELVGLSTELLVTNRQ